jgi:hypothetical protein
MKPATHQLFSQLCETFLPEASTSLDIVRSQPGGQAVIQQLHKTAGLAHDQSYSPVPKIAWSDLKDSYRGAWVIIKGSRGTGAIRAKGGNTGSYEAMASTDSEVKSMSDSRGGNVLDFLKAEIGNLQQFFVGKNTTAVKDKQSARKQNQQGAGAAPVVDQQSLMLKFKPLWAKAMNAALADIKGMVGTMVKNDAFEKAEKKIGLLKQLERGLDSIESGNAEVPEFISKAVSSAILMSASHYYPEETGEIQRPRYGGGYSSENPEGPKKLLADISAGDTKKLGTILAFFKRSLISG